MATIYFLRHGECQANLDGVYAGHDDSPLTAKGKAQAVEASNTSGLPPFAKVVSSDLERARETAAIVCDSLGLDTSKIVYDQRLREVGLGRLVGTPSRDMRGYVEAANEVGNPQGVEPLAAVEARLRAVLDEVKELRGAVLLVGHNGSGLLLKKLVTGDTTPAEAMPKLANGSIEKFGEISS